MESKINGKMDTISTSITDTTDTGVSGLMEAGYSKSNTKLSASSSVRNFGNAGTMIHGLNPSSDCVVFKDFTGLDTSLPPKYFYDRGNLVKVQRTAVATSESFGACKFIKDEKEASVIMDTPCPNFDPSPEISALDTCGTDRKQQLGLSEVESTSFTPATGVPRSGLEGSSNFFIDLNQSDQLGNPIRTDSRCALPGKTVNNFDGSAQTSGQVAMYRSEVARWQMQTSPAEPQYWCQSVAVAGDPEALQFLCVSFSSMPPQRLCVICGDEASGCHYSVLTCGSCKVFFKRAVEGHHSYLCAGRNDCIVDKIRRKNCPACRLRKCYQAGMMLGGRKLKRFGALKALGLAPALMFQSHLAMSNDNQALTSMACLPGIHEFQLSQQIISVLENIEPEIVYSGYDNSQPDVPHLLLNSLNRLCEKQLLWIVKWSKSLPGFRNLHITDQMTLIQYSWMNLMVFSLGWRSFQNVTSEYLYFAPDLVLSQEQMRRSPIYDLCLAIQFIPQEFANLQVTREEFLCMKAIILLNTVPLEGLKSQAAFDEMRQNYIRELSKAIQMREKGVVASSQRFYHLTKLMDTMHDIVKKVNLFCLSTFIQADTMKVEFPEMMTEVIASQLPKVLAGMVRPLLFHTK
uniref:Progesterone receptor n=1 Tax=Acanthochromis polyacanthus TaxID=80966 RepID=A0A3Q1GRD6_9TELE